MAEGVRQQRGEATRTMILNVSRRLFSDFGYHNTGIADIQAATGLTKGAFYHHFRAKQDLALAVLELVREDYAREIFGPASSQKTAGRSLASLIDTLVEANNRPEWANCRLMATLFAEVTPADGALMHAVQSLQEEMLDKFSEMIEAAQQSDEAVPGPARIWAQLLFSVFMGLVLMRKTGPIEPDTADVVGLVKARLLMTETEPADEHAQPLPKPVHLPANDDLLA